jgi:hypothetical protein
MKTLQLTIISLLVSTGLVAESISTNASELSWVDEQVKAIKPPRSGAKSWYLGSVKNPFIFLRQTKSNGSKSKASSTHSKTASVKGLDAPKPVQKLTLEAIINKSALIDGKWYKEGQTVYGYKLEKVSGRNVLLKKSKKNVLLTTKSERKSLKFNNN